MSNTITNSIHSHRNYESIVEKSKELKAEQEAGGTAFGAALLSQSYNLEMIHEAGKIKQKTVRATAPTENNVLQTNMNTIKYDPATYGYSVDSNGFMGEDFNMAAGLPQDFKIHKTSLDEIAQYNESSYLGTMGMNVQTFDNMDMADTIGHYYRLFTEVIGNNMKDSYSADELENMPVGFSYAVNQQATNDGDFLLDVGLFQITNVYVSASQLQEAYDIKNQLSDRNIVMNVTKLDLSPNGLNKETNFNPKMSLYKDGDGYTNAGVFMGFLKGITPRLSDSGETKLSDRAILASAYGIGLDPKRINNFSEMNFLKMAEEEISVHELLKLHRRSLAQEAFGNSPEQREEDEKLAERIRILAAGTLV